jgi:prepilin peptidase CpaA
MLMLGNVDIQSWAWLQWGAILGASLVACIWDLRTRRVPNRLTLPLLAAGLLLSTWFGGRHALGEAATAVLLLAAPYVVLFVLGHGGAGDAKLMAALGAWLGLREAVIVLACVAGLGGLLALAQICAHHAQRTLLRQAGISLYLGLIALAGGGRLRDVVATNDPEGLDESARNLTLPYGLAIFLGVCLAWLVVQLWM